MDECIGTLIPLGSEFKVDVRSAFGDKDGVPVRGSHSP